MVCDRRFGDASISLGYVGANIGRQPLELERWPLIEQAPADGASGWHQLEVVVDQGLMEVFLNGNQINERPLPAERAITDIANVDAGYAGVYAGHIGEASPAEARIDAFYYLVPERRSEQEESGGQRIDVLQPGKPREITIAGVHGGTTLQRHRSDVCISSEVAGSTGSFQQAAQNRPVMLAGCHRLDARLLQPRLHKRQSNGGRQRAAHDAGAGRDPDEGQDHDPGQPDRGRVGQRSLEPAPGRRVPRSIRIDGVDQEIGIDQDHLRRSISAAIS